jgi:hypothetical protein
VSKVERGRRPDPIRSHWEDWADAYDLSLKRFLSLCDASMQGGFGLPLWEMVEATGGDVVQTSALSAKERLA